MTQRPLQTSEEILRSKQSPPPLADRLWRQTSIVRPRAPIAGMSGRHRKDCIYFQRGDDTIMRRYVVPFDPKKPVQLVRRATFGEGSAHWSTLPEPVRQAWADYALEHLRIRYPHSPGRLLAVNAHTAAQVYRTGMGHPMAAAAPAVPPPDVIIGGIEELPSDEAGTLRFRLTHSAEDFAGLGVLFQITRPLASAKRLHVRNNEFLWAAQSDPDSFLELGPDGAEYEIANPVTELPPGAFYAVRVRAVTEDGMAGVPTTQYLQRL